MVTLVVSECGFLDLTLSCSLEDTRLKPSIHAIACHFQLDPTTMEITLDGTGQYLLKHDGYFVCPDYCLKFADPVGFTCFPAGDHCSEFSSESDSDENAQTLDADTAPLRNKNTATGPLTYPQEAYQFLKFGTRPQRYTGSAPGVGRDFKNFKQRVKRTFFLDGDKMLERRNVNRPYKGDFRNLLQGYNDRIVIATREEMMELIHELHNKGHPRPKKMEHCLRSKYKHPKLRKLINEVFAACTTCPQFNVKVQKHVEAIITSEKQELIMWDLFDMPWETTEGYKHILLVKCHFTKFTWAYALKTKTALETAKHVYSTFRSRATPKRFHSDNGPEFVNSVMHELLILMGAPDYTHGRPYNPQTQGLVENGNKDLKKKLVADAIARGGVTHVEGNEYDWVQDIWETVDTMNDLPIEMYGGVVTPFMALNDGVPRNMPYSRRLSAHDIEEMHVMMYKAQISNARKRGLTPKQDPLRIGTLVLARATAIERQKNLVLGEWTARGIIHGVSVRSSTYYIVLWLTTGVGSLKTSYPGDLSMPISRQSLRPVMDGLVHDIAMVYDERPNGFIVIVATMDNGDCKYMFLDGEWKGKMYTDRLEEVQKLPSAPYDLWLKEQNDMATEAKEKTDAAEDECEETATSQPSSATSKSKTKKKRYTGKRRESPNPKPTPKSSRKRKASPNPKSTPDSASISNTGGRNRAKRAKYVNRPSHTVPEDFTSPVKTSAFRGSDDPQTGIWLHATSQAGDKQHKNTHSLCDRARSQ